MKWLILQSDGEHAANKHQRECYGIADALSRIGHDAHIWGKRHHGFHSVPDFEEFDAIFCAEQYEFEWLPDFTKIKKPLKIQWVIDSHIHSRYAELKGFNIALHAIQSRMSGYDCAKNIWFPTAFDQRFHAIEGTPKTRELGFVGSMGGGRREYVDRLSRDFPCFDYSFTIGNEMYRKIQSFKIHWNLSASCDINNRTLETIGMGTCLITNIVPNLIEDLGFIDGENCLLYESYDECREKIRKTLDDGSYSEIGRHALKLSHQHTYQKRLESLIKSL